MARRMHKRKKTIKTTIGVVVVEKKTPKKRKPTPKKKVGK